jgi:hypothetical protein
LTGTERVRRLRLLVRRSGAVFMTLQS